MTTIEKVARGGVGHVARMFGRAIKGGKVRGFASQGHSVPLRALDRKKELGKAFKATGRLIKRNPLKTTAAVGAAGTYAATR